MIPEALSAVQIEWLEGLKRLEIDPQDPLEKLRAAILHFAHTVIEQDNQMRLRIVELENTQETQRVTISILKSDLDMRIRSFEGRLLDQPEPSV